VRAVDRRMGIETLLELLRETGLTRLVVYDGLLDRVVGILHSKDLFHVLAQEHVVILEDAIRPVATFSPELSIMYALRQFRRGRRHLAVVRKEGGPLLGICTLEDVLEEIVGQIEDEHDEPTPAGSE